MSGSIAEIICKTWKRLTCVHVCNLDRCLGVSSAVCAANLQSSTLGGYREAFGSCASCDGKAAATALATVYSRTTQETYPCTMISGSQSPPAIPTTQRSSTAHPVAVATPPVPVTVFLPSTQTGPMPSIRCATVTVSNTHPPQSTNSVCVLGGTVIVQPKGEVDVIVLVQVGEGEQAVRVVVLCERVVGRAQRTLRIVS
jgi:hypothetical protein